METVFLRRKLKLFADAVNPFHLGYRPYYFSMFFKELLILPLTNYSFSLFLICPQAIRRKYFQGVLLLLLS